MSALPAKKINPFADEEIQLALQQTLAEKQVLVVDRHSAARDTLRRMLSELGVNTVQGAGNSAEALYQVKSRRFDIILSDFVLDDERNGQQLLEELRHTHQIPLASVYVIITSERSYTNVVSLAELSPDDYLVKPFTADQLKRRLLRAIYKKHVLRHIYSALERGALHQAVLACDRVIGEEAAYRYDALRFKGELLQQLGRPAEAEAVFRQVLAERVAPWAQMGLAAALRDQGALDEAVQLAEQVIAGAPDYLSAYDFLAAAYESRGKLAEAQQALQRAANASPHNTLRQRLVGDIAVRNGDLLTAEKAFGRVIARSRRSSLRNIDDHANLARVFVERGNLQAARKLASDIRREWRGDGQGELAALLSESLCLQAEGAGDKAKALVDKALALQKELTHAAEARGKPLSQRLAVDLAQASYTAGRNEAAEKILRQVVAENNEDTQLLSQVTDVFARTGQGDAGQALLDQISQEIIELNNRGVLAARAGDLQGAVEMLCQAADQTPCLQFLVNAAKAIFTLLDRDGWDAELAARATGYLERAERKSRDNPKVLSARALCVEVTEKYGGDGEAR